MMGWVDETGGGHGVVRSDSWTWCVLSQQTAKLKHHVNVSFFAS